MPLQTKSSTYLKSIFVVNWLLLLGHLILQPIRKDLNWLRLGERSKVSQEYMSAEGIAAMLLVLAF